MITELKDNQYLVVGTNALGIHAGGAAAQAHRDFGALMGCARGAIGGQSYGIVTLDGRLEQETLAYIAAQVDDLRTIALANPDREFLLTPVGTGIAGFSYEDMDEIFINMPTNVTRVGWEK